MKKIVCILLAVCLVACLSVAALAEDYTHDPFSVTFTASKTMSKSYSEDDLTAAYTGENALQPGDSVTLTFNLKNESDVSTTWYIKNSVLDGLERNTSITDGAYTYVLTSIDSNNKSTTLFDSYNVNSEQSAESGEGLDSATEGLEDWNALFDLDAGKSGTVTLMIALDGESQANQYQDSDATVDLSFATEVNSTSGTASSQSGTSIVRTGDQANMPVMVIVAAVSGVLLLGLAIWSVKSRKHEKEDATK